MSAITKGERAERPFKIVAVEPGNASVIDRASGEKVGYVLEDFYGNWESFLSSVPGQPIGLHRSRTDAAEWVWNDARPERGEAHPPMSVRRIVKQRWSERPTAGNGAQPGERALCEQRGYHVQHGSGTGTSVIVWNEYCQDCGANLMYRTFL